MNDTDWYTTGIVIVDHGSRRAEANGRHERFVADWRARSDYCIVEPAHMELAEPSIGTAFDSCVAAGARHIVIAPFFLWPGNHWDRDIPALAVAAAARHPGVGWSLAATLGPHPLLMDIIDDRIRQCVEDAEPVSAPVRARRLDRERPRRQTT